MTKTKVLIIDDSALIRQMLTEILNSDRGIEVVGTAADPYIARDKIKQLNPDVLTLDVEMPRMDGVTFLANLMRLRPMPVVMVSSLTERGADVTLDALELGAVDYVTKPKIDLAATFEDYAEEVISKVKMAAKANIRCRNEKVTLKPRKIDPKLSADAVLKKAIKKQHFKTTDTIIALGASTGGTEAIRELLETMPGDAPGMVITQHIPVAFSTSFAERMNSISEMNVYEAKNGQHIVPGDVYIAPGDRHLLVKRDGSRYICRLHDGPPVNRHKPSVDVMFRSVADNVGKNAVGIILTGMGTDGAKGLKEMQEMGAPTIAQDEKTSVVWGMPGEAVKIGGVKSILPLSKISKNIIDICRNI